MNSFLYELLRTLKSKTIVIITVVIIAISVFSTYNTYGNPQNAINSDSSVAYGYGSNGTYHFVFRVTDLYGNPVQGSRVQFALVDGSGYSLTTGANGYANRTVQGVNSTQVYSSSYAENMGALAYNYTGTGGAEGIGFMNVYSNQTGQYQFKVVQKSFVKGNNNTTLTNHSRYSLNGYQPSEHSNEKGLQVTYEGNVGQDSPEVSLYYLPINGTTLPGGGYSVSLPSPLNQSNMVLYGNFTGFANFRINPQNLTGSNISFYMFVLYTPSGIMLGQDGFQIIKSISGQKVSQQFFNTELSIMGLFVPLMAVMAAYVSFGRDMTSGITESVLARPVTRKALISSRYAAGVTATFLALLVSLAASSYFFKYFEGTALPLDTFITGLWSLSVTVAAYFGLGYFASTFVKSGGALLGASIGMFLAFDFLWAFSAFPIIPGLITSTLLGLNPGSTGYLKSFVDLYYISPAGLPDIASLQVSGNSYFVIYVQKNQLAEVGLTYLNMIIAGLLWTIVPFAMSVVSFSRRG